MLTVALTELALRAGTWLLAAAARRQLAPTSYTRILAYTALVLAPLLPTCCTSYAGFAATLLFCSVPCCAAPIGLSACASAVLVENKLPADLLLPPPGTMAALALPSTLAALFLGPSDWGAEVAAVAHSVAVLLVARIVWTAVRMGLLMPSLLSSHGPPMTQRPRMTQRDQRLEELRAGQGAVAMQVRGVRFRVSRHALGRGGVDAVAVEHPAQPAKWVVLLHGNGEFLRAGIDLKAELAAKLGCSVIAVDYRGVGRSAGLLLSADDAVDDAAEAVRYCEARVAEAGGDPTTSILLMGQSMGGGVAAQLAGRHYPWLPCVNERSFASLSLVSACTVGLHRSALGRAAVRFVLRLAFSRVPWRAPLESAEHWRRLRGGKMLVYHPNDRVIGHAAALHTVLEQRGHLDGTEVIRLGGRPYDAHNEDPDVFAPVEWEAATAWMRRALHLAGPTETAPSQPPPTRRGRSPRRAS